MMTVLLTKRAILAQDGMMKTQRLVANGILQVSKQVKNVALAEEALILMILLCPTMTLKSMKWWDKSEMLWRELVADRTVFLTS